MKKIKYYLVLFILILCSHTLNAQIYGQELIDSLTISLEKSIDDTNKVNLLAELSLSYNIISPEKGIEIANLGVELASKLKWKPGLAKNYNALIKNSWAVGDFDLAMDIFGKELQIEEELGLKKENITGNINRTFTYPKSEFTELTKEIRNYLDELANYMKDNPGVIIAVTGHSDNFGTFEQNDTRAKERAQHIVEYLAKKGISKKRVLAGGKGSLSPIASNDTDAGRRKNRRIEIRFAGNLK